jgi:hypothetical protein
MAEGYAAAVHHLQLPYHNHNQLLYMGPTLILEFKGVASSSSLQPRLLLENTSSALGP